MKILFLGLRIFSSTGGIEQVNKNWLFALSKLKQKRDFKLLAISMYDSKGDLKYIDDSNYKSANGNRWFFGVYAIWYAVVSDIIIIPHLNLSLFALIAKLVNPKLKIIIQLHGIETWGTLSGVQERLLLQADKILAVSKFTMDNILLRYPQLKDNLYVLPNSLDPIKTSDFNHSKREAFRTKLNLDVSKKLIITVGRIVSSEAYKGYDKTIEAIALLNNPSIVFHIIGKYDDLEYSRITKIIEDRGLQHCVKLVGFVTEEVLENYYQAADLFIMPSKGEGFGLVFIEAMANGLRVIAGNADGSVDAVGSINESRLVSPDNEIELCNVIDDMLNVSFSENDKVNLSNKCKKIFSSESLEQNIEKSIF